MNNSIIFDSLPMELTQYNFNDLYSYKPKDRNKVIVYDKNKDEFFEKTIFRSYIAFGNVPVLDLTLLLEMFLNLIQNIKNHICF